MQSGSNQELFTPRPRFDRCLEFVQRGMIVLSQLGKHEYVFFRKAREGSGKSSLAYGKATRTAREVCNLDSDGSSQLISALDDTPHIETSRCHLGSPGA
jgi:hypothetical protein